jgi:hypothetical protein
MRVRDILLVIAVTLMCSKVMLCQPAPRLALDKAKPFVYIEFDHVGPRPPVEDGEPDQGLWLRFVNNSSFPIEVHDMSTSTDPELTILPDEIVGRMITIFGSGGQSKEPPPGYSASPGGGEIIQPGKKFSFSVPVNHVSPAWYMRVPFRFKLQTTNDVPEPDCFAVFVWEQIPEKIRRSPPLRDYDFEYKLAPL